MQLNTPIEIDAFIQYIVVAYHRNGSYPKKSQWSVPPAEEVGCFTQSHKKEWLLKDIGWGLIIDGFHKFKVLGSNPQGEELVVAKFKTDNKNLWHGYPADLKRNPKDIPVVNVLIKWRQEGIIEKHHMSKLQRGITCSL